MPRHAALYSSRHTAPGFPRHTAPGFPRHTALGFPRHCFPRSLKRGGLAQGFTILEIMIATAILTLGLVSILALFPVAINTGKQVVETSTAVVIAESVADAIREGVRNHLRYGPKGVYFVFKHDGVTDPIPGRTADESPEKDYYVLLPRFPADRGGTYRTRDEAMKVAKTFVYPETDPEDQTSGAPPNGGGDPVRADNDADDQKLDLRGGESVLEVRVAKTYKMGRFLPDDTTPDGPEVLADQKIDALKQYSYAFSIQASREDANLSQSEGLFQPANRLYHVKIMVFRGFSPPAPDAKSMAPAYSFDFEVSA
jgi:type II secretory pathway pseudopilin PulG